MPQVFLSHSSADDALVRRLQQALADLGEDRWIDSRELRGGDPLWPAIQQAIESAAAFAVLVSPDGLQSRWVGKELRHALDVQSRRSRAGYPVIPLTVDDTRLGVLEGYFEDEPAYIPISSAPGGIDAALNAILIALGRRLPADVAPTPQPAPEPIEELVLELTDLRYEDLGAGVRRPSARARLVHEPAPGPQGAGRREVASARSWRLTAPLGPIEADDIRWYLEKYAVWPGTQFAERARRVEQDLARWGQDLHQAALPAEHTANVLQSWSRIGDGAARRFSVLVDWEAALEAAATPEQTQTAREAATALLGLPWELLHDGAGFLFQGRKPVRVRRRLPNTRVLDLPLLDPPIRCLLVSPRPEDGSCGYIDHRVSALALVEAMEGLGGLVELAILSPPTLGALREELARAAGAHTPYHVVHFDGHGVYDRRAGLGGLCFEDPNDTDRLDGRRHQTVFTDTLGPLLRDHRIPLVFLEACQSAQAEQASESVASELLKVGVASVVAMSHSVLVETARRFVAAFYVALASGQRVGQAMLAGQQALHEDSFRGSIFGAGELRLKDWFVPVLYQEREDPALFHQAPAPHTRADLTRRLQTRLGAIPDPPPTGFVGRSRELLALERQLRPAHRGLLRKRRWALIRGQGGEGKTALACELGRWLVRSGQVERAAFCSVESHGLPAAVLDALGRQLVGPQYSAAAYPDQDHACQPIERALKERPTLLIIDNLESILLPPYQAAQTPAAIAEEGAATAAEILALCTRLLMAGETRIVFTSREALPAPFDRPDNRRELTRLAPVDAVQFVERVLNLEGAGTDADAAREEIEALVEAVHGHARTLALIAPSLRALGPARTRVALVDLMAQMERDFPGSREQSVYAGVALSVQRLAPVNQERVRVLGVFHGGFQMDVLRTMTGWSNAEIHSLGRDLTSTGLATLDPYGHLTLNPALCPWLRERLTSAELEDLSTRWGEAMGQYVGFLVQRQGQRTEVAATLTLLGLPSLFALLDRVQAAGEAEATIDLATSLYRLLQWLGRPRLLARVGQVRDAAAQALGAGAGAAWGHARFEAERTRIEQQLADGRLREAITGAQALLQRARAAGGVAYSGADCDLAGACFLLARVLTTAGGVGPALPLLDEARQGFEAIARDQGDQAAERMASACLTEQGNCLLYLGRLDESAAAYAEGIRRAERRGDERSVAVGQGNLGTVRLQQRRYREALDAYAQARARFTDLGEQGGVALYWHQTGRAYQESGNPGAAEDAYRESLAIAVRLGNRTGQAGTLTQLGNLYKDVLNRPEESVTFYRQAADLYVEIGDEAKEGLVRSNLGDTLRRLGRLDEARRQVQRAIECKAPFGHAAEPWKTWAILADIESAAANPGAAAAASDQARAAYLAYRRDGGESYSGAGRLALAVTVYLNAGDRAAARSLLRQAAADPFWQSDLGRPFIQALDVIAAGSRDPTLGEAPGLYWEMATEVQLLLETLA